MNKQIFEPTVLAGIQLNNKIIRSATHEGMADEKGYPTEQLKKKYIQLAKGEVGAIITGYAGIQQNGKSCHYRMLMIDDDASIPYYRDLVEAGHAHNTPIILQIAHCGRQTRSKITGERTVSPSAIRDKYYSEEVPKALTEAEIEEIIDNFVRAIERAKQAGFDGVQLHLAHGYLLAEFLSPYMNRRRDRWGGTTENRFRIIGEIYKKARAKIGDYPILVKLNTHDGRKNGMRIEEAVKIAKLLEDAGCAAIETSCGVFEDGMYTCRSKKVPTEAVFAYQFKFKNLPAWIKAMLKPVANIISPPAKPISQYNVPAAQAIKTQVSIPVIVVGGLKSLADMTDIIENNKADFVALSRPFVIEANLVKKFKEGKQDVSKCLDCGYCAVAQEIGPLRCYYGKLKPASVS